MNCPFILDVVLAVMVIVVSILLVIISLTTPVWTRLRWFIEDIWYMVKKWPPYPPRGNKSGF